MRTLKRQLVKYNTLLKIYELQIFSYMYMHRGHKFTNAKAAFCKVKRSGKRISDNRNLSGKQKLSHYANMSVQYFAIFHSCKNDNFQRKLFDIFLIFAQNIDCGCKLEPPH